MSIVMLQAWEDERRKANKSLREAKAAADSDLLKLKQSLADAEQQRHHAVRQCEAEGHRSVVKLAQAGRSLKAARQEVAEAQRQAKVYLGVPHRQGLSLLALLGFRLFTRPCHLSQAHHSACKPRAQRHSCFMPTATQLGVQHILLCYNACKVQMT